MLLKRAMQSRGEFVDTDDELDPETIPLLKDEL